MKIFHSFGHVLRRNTPNYSNYNWRWDACSSYCYGPRRLRTFPCQLPNLLGFYVVHWPAIIGSLLWMPEAPTLPLWPIDFSALGEKRFVGWFIFSYSLPSWYSRPWRRQHLFGVLQWSSSFFRIYDHLCFALCSRGLPRNKMGR